MPKKGYEVLKEDSREIGQRLRWARELDAQTPTELAAKIGVDSSLIRVIERGARLPSIHTLMAVCRVLRISPQYLLWGSLEGVEPTTASKLKMLHPGLSWPASPSERVTLSGAMAD